MFQMVGSYYFGKMGDGCRATLETFHTWTAYKHCLLHTTHVMVSATDITTLSDRMSICSSRIATIDADR